MDQTDEKVDETINATSCPVYPESFGSLVSGRSVALFSRSKKLKSKRLTKLVSSDQIVQT